MKKTIIIIVIMFIVGGYIILKISKKSSKDKIENVTESQIDDISVKNHKDSLNAIRADSLRALYGLINIPVVQYRQALRKIENYLIVHRTGNDTLAEKGVILFIAYDAEWDRDTTLTDRWRIDLIVVDNKIVLKDNLVSLTKLK